MSEQVWLGRLALTAIAALAGLLYAWAMGRDTLEFYYAAADRSMSVSWHDFIFGAFDPAGTITVDKLPGALWLQALSVRAFGMHTWAIILPQVIEGILTVLVLYRAVRRLAGPGAGRLEETEQDGRASSGPKHWHTFDILARNHLPVSPSR